MSLSFKRWGTRVSDNTVYQYICVVSVHYSLKVDLKSHPITIGFVLLFIDWDKILSSTKSVFFWELETKLRIYSIGSPICLFRVVETSTSRFSNSYRFHNEVRSSQTLLYSTLYLNPTSVQWFGSIPVLSVLGASLTVIPFYRNSLILYQHLSDLRPVPPSVQVWVESVLYLFISRPR